MYSSTQCTEDCHCFRFLSELQFDTLGLDVCRANTFTKRKKKDKGASAVLVVKFEQLDIAIPLVNILM